MIIKLKFTMEPSENRYAITNFNLLKLLKERGLLSLNNLKWNYNLAESILKNFLTEG